MIVTFILGSWCQVEFFGAPGRVGLPAAAGRAAPVELARPEAAILAAIARQPSRVAMHQVAHELEVAPALRARRGDDLGLEQAVEAEERGISPQLVANERVRRFRPLGVERLLEDGVEEVERRIALQVPGEQSQPLLRAARLAMRLEQPLRGERDVRRVLLLDALPVLDRLVEPAGAAGEVAELDARAHALPVRLKGGAKARARRLGPRLRGLRGRLLAEVLGEVAGARLRVPRAELPRHLDRPGPVLLLLVDLQQPLARELAVGGIR